jgi:hypothetical protein
LLRLTDSIYFENSIFYKIVILSEAKNLVFLEYLETLRSARGEKKKVVSSLDWGWFITRPDATGWKT